MAETKPKQNKLKNILLAVIPGLIVFGLVFAIANTYYDLDLNRIVTVDDQEFRGKVFLGAMEFASDSGVISWINMPVSTTTPGLPMSYTAEIDEKAILTIYSETDGDGTVENLRVGIATTSPAYTLDVAGDLRTTATATVAGFIMPTGASSTYVLTSVDDSGVGIWSPLGDAGGITGTGMTNYLTRWTGISTVSTSTIYDDGTYVGIGTSSPAYTLDVGGTVSMLGFRMPTNASSGFALISDSEGIGTWEKLSAGQIGGIEGSGTTNFIPRFNTETTLTDSIIYDSGTSIGISTTSAAYTLNVSGTLGVSGTSSLNIIDRGTWQGTAIGPQYGGTGTSSVGWTGFVYVEDGAWSTTSAPTMNLEGGQENYIPIWASDASLGTSTIYQSGTSIGIGTTEPQEKFHLAGGNFLQTAAGFTPKEVGSLNLPTSAYGVYVSGKYAYVVTGSAGDDFHVIDISDPTNPVEVGSLNLPDGAWDVYVSGKYAYVVTALTGNAFHVIDISDPTNPVEVGSLNLPDSAWDVYVSGKYAYVVTLSADDDFHVIDISDPTNPVEVGSLNLHASAWGVYVSGKYAYVVTSATDDDFHVIDISDPTNPVEVGSLDLPTSAYGVYVSGKYAYVVTLSPGDAFKVIDIAGIDAPSATIGNIAAGSMNIWENLTVQNNIYAQGGLNVGPGGIYSAGPSGFYTTSSVSALSVIQTGSGNILDFRNATGSVFNIASDGTVTVAGDILPATTTAHSLGSETHKWQHIYSATSVMDYFRMATGASSGYVLTSDASGAGTWSYLGDIGGVTGTGEANYLTRWTGISTVSTSTIYDDGDFVGISTSTRHSDERLTVFGNIYGSGNIVIAGTIDTGQGATNIYAMDQDIKTTDSPTFAGLTLSTTPLAITSGGTGATSSADARTNLGLEIGTHVQAYNAGLDSISGLTTDENQMLFLTGSNSYSTTTLTAFARDILADGDAASTRTTIGLGNVENIALSTWPGSINITTLGTIATGTWEGDAVAVQYGGTGRDSHTAYGLLAGGTTSTGTQQSLTTGTSGQILKSQGDSSLPAWSDPAALTKTDDTNVTLTLGGASSTALVNAASITLGWTGQLAVDRGGTGLDSLGLANQILGVNDAAGSLEYKTIGGTTDRLTVSHSAEKIDLDISSSYAGQDSITTLGIIATGTWQGTAVGTQWGGTGTSSDSWTGFVYVEDGTWSTTSAPTMALEGGQENYIPVWVSDDSLGTSTIYQSGTSIGIGTTSAAYTLNVSGTLGVSGTSSLNIIDSGTWQGTAIAPGFGGTGLTSYAVGDLIYASGATTLSRLAGVEEGNALISGGVSTAPTWGKIGLTSHVTGTLPVTSGGTGVTSLSNVVGTDNQVTVDNGTARVIGGDVTLSLPQNIHTGATPQFTRLGLGTEAHATYLLNLGGALVHGTATGLGIGTTSPATLLQVVGTTTARDILPEADDTYDLGSDDNVWANVFSWNFSGPSSIRLKENIEEISGALDMISGLRGVYYTRKDQTDPRRELGFIGEEIGTMIPELVTWDEDNNYIKGLEYSRITALNLQAIKELNIKLEGLADIETTHPAGSFAESFFSNLFTRIRSWMADAANGIGKLFAGEVHTEKLCVGDICVTEQEFEKTFGSGSGGSTTGGLGGSSGGSSVEQAEEESAEEEVTEEEPAEEEKDEEKDDEEKEDEEKEDEEKEEEEELKKEKGEEEKTDEKAEEEKDTKTEPSSEPSDEGLTGQAEPEPLAPSEVEGEPEHNTTLED